ncbi:MAG: hypothetical protein AAGB02_07170 [Pseudomonadota bacterium]
MAGAISEQQIVEDPQWLPDRYNFERDEITFACLDRAALTRSAFLDERKDALSAGGATAPVSALAPFLKPKIRPVYIFHSAFCCSTLMARALDHEGKVLSLKEPRILNDLANAWRTQNQADARQRILNALSVVETLLARPHIGDEHVLIKPTNAANNLAPLVARSGARTLFLYGGLTDFLVSVIKKGEACRAFIRKQFSIFAMDETAAGRIPAPQLVRFTDLQIAALVWRHQLELFQHILETDERGGPASLDFLQLLDAPARTLQIVAQHFDLPISSEDVSNAVNGPVFLTDAKFADKAYGAAQRQKDVDTILGRHRDEIAGIENWAMNLTLDRPLAPTPPRPLIAA